MAKKQDEPRTDFTVLLRHYNVVVNCHGWWRDHNHRLVILFDHGDDNKDHAVLSLCETDVLGVFPPSPGKTQPTQPKWFL